MIDCKNCINKSMCKWQEEAKIINTAVEKVKSTPFSKDIKCLMYDK